MRRPTGSAASLSPASERFGAWQHARSRLSRRELLDAAWKLGAWAIAAPRLSARLSTPSFSAYPFPLGVASGDPRADGVVVWTRLAPEPLAGGGMPPAPVQVGWEIARDETFRQIEQSGAAIAVPEWAHSVHVEVAGLAPHRDYWYRFHAAGETSAVGRTRTAPALAEAPARVRFAICGCNNYEAGYFTALRAIAEESFEFVVHTGDYIYEDSGEPRPNGVRTHHGGTLSTLEDYRSRYAQYKLDPDMQAAHASSPFVVTWDDHEVANDYAGAFDRRDTPPAVFLLRRAAAYQAYYEHMPLRTNVLLPGGAMRIYRRLRFGRLLDVNVLDTRQYRSRQACGGQDTTDCAGAHDPSRTMMGEDQERWLSGNLRDAHATYTVIAQQVPTFARDAHSANPQRAFMMDKWDGYTADRDRLYAQIVRSRAPNPVILSGDVHLHYAADVKVDYTDPRSPTIAAELTNTSLTSNGDGADVSRDWERIRSDNPHIRYHSARRGYISCTATRDALRADFRVIEKVTERGYPTRTGATVIVEAGRPGVVLE
jgi:alkaline phosphatase D